MAYQATGRMPEELANAPSLPPGAAHVWHWFLELNKARVAGGFAMNPLTYGDIDAWVRLTKTRIEPWELRAICLVDAKLMEVSNSK